MHSRRTLGALLLAAATVIVGTSPAHGATPIPTPPTQASVAPGERPLTAAEQKLSQAKVAAAEAFAARLGSSGFGLVSLACVPNVAPPGSTATPSAAPARTANG